MSEQNREGLALLVLRLGLAWFIFLWAAHKVITPKQYQGLARHFDGIDLEFTTIYAVAGVQVLICVLVAVGAVRWISYPALALMHLFTVLRRWEGFFDPFTLNDRGFPIHRNQVIDLAVLGAMIALILLIHRDRWSVGAWWKRRGA
ncbi:hypothetical protein [uncultured Tateyamaria sp.]|uniref:hypothetical protein n=1 Tax=uncultured Tateyamaria sp. TaxID=455651 RepID=UPI0026194A4C|nr:hypothetical protein [uncultured Tateyamaria sp.]